MFDVLLKGERIKGGNDAQCRFSVLKWAFHFGSGTNLHTLNFRFILHCELVAYTFARTTYQGLWKPSDSGTPVAFPASELDKLRDLPVWETLSGKRVKIVRARHFIVEEGANIAGLPLPPSALDRCGRLVDRCIPYSLGRGIGGTVL